MGLTRRPHHGLHLPLLRKRKGNLFSPLEAFERLGITLLSDERHFASVVQPDFVAHEHNYL
jgi:hypothetical protein